MTWLADLEREEQNRTGIKNLRVKYNGAFGYFIEITKSYLPQVPPEYIRKQTMTNAERFTTESLRQKEREILHAEELSKRREEEIFQQLVSDVRNIPTRSPRPSERSRKSTFSGAGRNSRASGTTASPMSTSPTQ